jgi:hypothetical protein
MAILVFTGGKQKKNATTVEEWSRYDGGVIITFDLEKRKVLDTISYYSPSEFIPNKEPSVLLKSSSIEQNTLLTCTQTEVLKYDLNNLKLIKRISNPVFNDVHHVIKHGDNYLVVSTGLDALFEVNEEGDVINEWSTIDKGIWERFDKNVDYRKVLSTKPHSSHPNFIAKVGDELWITRFEQRDAKCLTDSSRPVIPIGIQKPHDGLLYNGKLHYTTVNSHIVIADPKTSKILEVINLNEIDNTLLSLGWCRGLYIDGDVAIVGFTRIRPTKFLSNIDWLKNPKRNLRNMKSKPTRIAAYNIKSKTKLWEFSLENNDMNAIF